MADKPQGYRFDGMLTRRKRKLREARKSSGGKTVSGVGYITECLWCPWASNKLRRQNEPVRVSCSGLRGETVTCKEGHVWRTT